MARNNTQVVEVVKSEGLDRVVAAGASRLFVLLPPWFVLAVLVILAAVSHARFGEPPAVSWATMAGTLATVVLSTLTWLVAHQRGNLGRVHSTLTTAFAGLWFTIATITGVGQGFTLGALFFGGLTLGFGWNIRVVIRQGGGEHGQGDALGDLFEQAKQSFGLKGARVRTREVSDHKIKAELALPAGEKVADDAIKKAPYIESGLKLPIGSVQITPNKDDASRAHFTVTDPRVMNEPIPWPGASRPGGCITEPLRVGVFADAEPAELLMPPNNVQIMGASGSGKSMGGGWNLLGEAITRRNVAIFGVDLAKADQTLGPLRPALHRLETTKAGASKFIRQLHAKIPERTEYLGSQGFNDWAPDCGLAFWLVLFEEVAKAFDILGSKDQEMIEQITKEIRSAGGRVIMSLQRSTYGEMPTIIRSQMAFMCFGLTTGDDTQYGISERQQRAEVAPEMWGAGNPDHLGKAFLDAAGVPETHYAMPLRTFRWGKTPREAAANMAAHAAEWPAAAKEADRFTVELADPELYAGRPVPVLAAASRGAERPAEALTAPGRDTGPARAVAAPREALSDAEPREIDPEVLGDAAELVVSTQSADPAMIQSRLRIGRAEAARVLEVLERRRVVGPAPADGGPRAVLVSGDDVEALADELREDGDAVGEHLVTEDPSPEVVAGPEDEIPDLEGEPLTLPAGDGRELSPAAARRLVEDWLRHRVKAGTPRFVAADPEFRKVREAAGRGRGWGYKVLTELTDAGVLEREEEEGKKTCFTIVNLAALDGPAEPVEDDDEDEPDDGGVSL